MTQIYLAFSHSNRNLADILEKNIPEIAFSRISDADDATPGIFAETVAAAPHPVVLLLTDNFIKSEAAMSGMLAALLSLMRQNRVMVVIANGTHEENGEVKAVETHIDRVVYAIQYMNYWQQRYLAMSDQYNHADDAHRAELFQRQQRLHDIADQAGELISALRDADPVKWDYLSVTGFNDVYRFAGITPPSRTNPEPVNPPPPVAPAPEPPAPNPVPTTTTVPVSGPLTFRPVEPIKPFQEPLAPPAPEFDPAAHLVHPNDADAAHPETGNYAEHDINNTIKDAWSWIERGNRDLGIEVLRSALEQYPQHEQLRVEYEKALHEDDAPEEVLAPQDDAAAYEAAGESAFADGDFLMAKYCWDRAAESNPDLPGIWKKLGFLASDQLTGYHETSIAYLKKAMAQDPDDETIVERLRKLGENIPMPEAAQPEQTDNNPQESSSVETTPPIETPVEVPVVATPPATAPVPAPAARRNEIVMVTGATSGIGRATAVEFARHGYRLIITGRRAERLFDLRTELETQFGVEVLPLVFDVRDQRAVEGNLTNLPESWQNIDILINNAGLAKGLAPIHEGELHHWETMIDTNIKGLLYVTQLVSRTMVARRRGHIVNLSSSAGKEAYPNGNVYCATKFAVEALTKSMRFDLHKYGIRVSQVSPGHVEETEFALTRFDGDGEKAKIYNDFQPLTARDVAEAIWFIASRPAHVNVQDVYMFGTQQASATVVDRSGRS
jgi:NADP-dependent 3-hydroxy acid dehydrogenase YdfG/tetratricopeptide (TPR) repeat protein